MKHIKYLLALVGMVALLVGCQHGKLETGGAYAPGTTSYLTNADSTITTNVVETSAPDMVLFNLDAAFKLAYTTVNTIFTLEDNNSALLWSVSHEIKHTLDRMRPDAVKAVQQYGVFRKQYIANPIPANLAPLQQTLSTMKSFASSAQAALPPDTQKAIFVGNSTQH
jgi:hypothetical protein